MCDLLQKINLDWKWNGPDLIYCLIGFFTSIIGAFLGLYFAILAQIKAEKKINSKEKQSIKTTLKNTVATMISETAIKNLTSMIEEGKDLSYSVLAFPYLEGLITTNKVMLLTDEIWFNDLINIYHIMQDINKWYSQKTDFYFYNISGFDLSSDLVETTSDDPQIISLQNKLKQYLILCKAISIDVEKRYFTNLKELYKKI